MRDVGARKVTVPMWCVEYGHAAQEEGEVIYIAGLKCWSLREGDG
jgi:hypothetical protein